MWEYCWSGCKRTGLYRYRILVGEYLLHRSRITSPPGDSLGTRAHPNWAGSQRSDPIVRRGPHDGDRTWGRGSLLPPGAFWCVRGCDVLLPALFVYVEGLAFMVHVQPSTSLLLGCPWKGHGLLEGNLETTERVQGIFS